MCNSGRNRGKTLVPLDSGRLADLRGSAHQRIARQLAENLDQFDYVYGVQTPGEYGEYMIKESGNFEYDENLGEYYDFEKYGLQRMEQEGGVFNQRGYIAYLGTLSLDELMMDDPAQEHGMEMGGME